jgi:iron(III) transport system ATP-binding protein
VALARALARQPDVVLLDEPFSSLDAGLREETGRAVISALRATGATAVLVTHHLYEAHSMADQVAVMRAGRVPQVGPPREVYEQPVDRGVAEFVGAAVVLAAQVSGTTATCALGDLTVTGRLGDGAGLVLVRPEQIALTSPQAAEHRARVLEVSYHGHDASVRLRLEAADVEVLARLAGSAAPAVCDVVGVTVSGPARLL